MTKNKRLLRKSIISIGDVKKTVTVVAVFFTSLYVPRYEKCI